ncbi:Coatomer subunit gamma-2, partial [Ophiophagus hannah]
MKHPSAVTACNLDLENLITDSNRSIATLAITTLLKTGSESSVDRLMKQISSFVVVVQAISALCQKYPRKHSVMMTFLSNMLRDDGGFEYKRAIVDCIIGIIEENPESKETGLAHLCEFIEDCEHTVLATKILHLLGKEGPRTPTPSKYIRFIFNRVVLENEAVRAGEFCGGKGGEFDCTNTLNDQLLEKVTVQMEPSEAYEVLRCVPAPSLSYNQPGMCYTLVRLPLDDPTAEAVNNIVKFLGMQPCERSDKVPENKNSHTLYLAGMFRGGLDVLVRARLALGDGVTMQVTVRSIVETPVDVILASVG